MRRRGRRRGEEPARGGQKPVWALAAPEDAGAPQCVRRPREKNRGRGSHARKAQAQVSALSGKPL